MPDLKAEMAAIRERISAAKRHGAHRGYIDYSGCNSVCRDLDDIVYEAEYIIEEAEVAATRAKYKKVCGHIKKLSKLGGKAYAEALVSELIKKYPRRPAMLEELHRIRK